jgi:ferredoxin
MPTDTINLSEEKYVNYLRQFSTTNWVLCVGAGICKGILPDWFDLTINLVNQTYGKKWDSKEFKKISDEVGFSLDSWIQGCYNKMITEGKTVDDFNEALEKSLYQNLLEDADKNDVKH